MAQVDRVRRAVQVDVAAKGVDAAAAVETLLFATEPKNPGEDPVALRISTPRCVIANLAGRTAATQNCTERQSGADLRADAVATARRAVAACLLAGTVGGGGHTVAADLRVVIQ